MNAWTRRLEIAVNISILAAFIVVAALAGQRLWSARAEARGSGRVIGAKVALPGVDWSRSERTLVLALSTTCHFCSESAGFYKRLLADVSGRGVHVMAVLPQDSAAGRAYLDGLGVPVSQVLQGSLDSVYATGTPTLLLLDAHGKIRKVWVGKLEPVREDEVIASLR